MSGRSSTQKSSLEDDTLNKISSNLSLVTKRLNALVSNSQGLNHSFSTVRKSCDRQTTVNLRVDVYRIEDIDISKQQFTTEFDLQVTWLDEERAKSLNESSEIEEFEAGWHPEIFFPNAVRLHMIQKTFSPGNTDGMFEIIYRIHGIFKTDFNLRDFPFDYQMLCISVSSKWNRDVVLFRQVDTSSMGSKPITIGDENQLRKAANKRYLPIEDDLDPTVTFRILISRKPGSYLLSVIPFYLLTSLLAAIILSFPQSLMTLLGLVLLLVTGLLFHRVVRRSIVLPDSHFAIIDEYIIATVALEVISMLCGTILLLIGDTNRQRTASFITFGSLFVIFVAIHATFLIRMIYKDVQRGIELKGLQKSATFISQQNAVDRLVRSKYRIVSGEAPANNNSALYQNEKEDVASTPDTSYSRGGELRSRATREKEEASEAGGFRQLPQDQDEEETRNRSPAHWL